MTDRLTLVIAGRRYDGWTSVRVTRGIDRCVADFDIAVTERWANQDLLWRILPFAPVTLWLGADLLLTGYVDAYNPAFGPDQHAVRITGRSKTADLVDCKPAIAGGQFAGYSYAAICRAVAALFGIDVVVQAPGASAVVADATMERAETGFAFLERLGRMAGVLLTDDAQGRLVLTTAGSTQAAGRLVQGQNIQHASATLSGRRRFSIYTVMGQHGLTPGATTVQTQQQASATDSLVPRFRPHVAMGETQMTQAQMQQRVNWMCAYAAGQATKATITVPGWRQPDGTLWQPNQIVAVTSDWLGIDQDLLAAQVEYGLSDNEGSTTTLTVGPIEGYTPDPGEVRLHKKKGTRHGKKGGGSGVNYSGAGGIA
ncbi:MAG: hypothetical protein HIU82_02115 [Proteobacteria bacterium]|nr:hypothetical protein [Pseudomonadota bacterium]